MQVHPRGTCTGEKHQGDIKNDAATRVPAVLAYLQALLLSFNWHLRAAYGPPCAMLSDAVN